MPTPETLRSLIGLLESDPRRESKFEFIVEPNGDLFRTIIGEDEKNFYLENDSLPVDFNDIFELNRPPSSFHGKIQATLGSIFQDCALQNIWLDDKDKTFGELIEEPANTTIVNSGEPVSNLHIEVEFDKIKSVGRTGGFKGEQSTTLLSEETFWEHDIPSHVRNQDLYDILLDNGLLASFNMVTSDVTRPDSEIGKNIGPEICDIWKTFAEFENIDPGIEASAINVCVNPFTVIMEKDDMETTTKMEDQARMVLLVNKNGLEHNACQLQLYRARR